MQSVSRDARLRALIAGLTLLLAVVHTTDTWSQRFLGFGRATCTGIVTITQESGPEIAVRPFDYRSVRINPNQSNEIGWRCDNQLY